MSSRRPRVVVVAEAFPMRGGIATFAETISADPLLGEDFEMELLNTARSARRPGGKLVWSNVAHALGDARSTYRASRTADIVHLQLVADPGLPMVRAAALCIAARLGGAKVIAHSHSATGNAGRSGIAGYGSRDRMLLRVLRLAELVLTVSDSGTETLRPVLGTTPVRTVDNAIDVAAITPSDLSAGTRMPTVLFVGVVCRRKGVHDLAAATAMLHERGVRDWRLIVAGGQGPTPEPEYQEMLAALDAAGVAGAAVGEQGHDGIRKYLSESDIFVLPSYLEGQPMAILEAMAAGLAVVGSDTGAVAQTVPEGVCGRVVQPGDVAAMADALEELICDHQLRTTWGAASRERAQALYDLPALSQRLNAAYTEVLEPLAGTSPRRRRTTRSTEGREQHV